MSSEESNPQNHRATSKRLGCAFSLRPMFFAFFVIGFLLMLYREIQEYRRERGGRDPIPLVVGDRSQVYVRRMPYPGNEDFQYEFYLPEKQAFEFCAAHFHLKHTDPAFESFRTLEHNNATLPELPEPEFVYPYRRLNSDQLNNNGVPIHLRMVGMSTDKKSNGLQPSQWTVKFCEVHNFGKNYMNSFEFTIVPDGGLNNKITMQPAGFWKTEVFSPHDNIVLYMVRETVDSGDRESPINGFVFWLRKAKKSEGPAN